MKLAIVHDYLVNEGGAENCLREFLELFPKADLFTLFLDRKKFSRLKQGEIKTSFLDRIPMLKKHYELFLPLYPKAVESLDFSGYDTVLSSSWAWSKGIRKGKESCHVCYCYTPMRFAHVMEGTYLRNKSPIARTIAKMVIARLRKWDLGNNKGVDSFIAISENVKERIKRFYGRDSVVIHPPVDTEQFSPPKKEGNAGYYFLCSRLVPFKRADIAVEAFNNLGLPLKIAGAGPELNRLQRMARPNIEFLGHVPQKELVELYKNCTAFIFPQEEDWGITALEAQSCGKPVIAFAKGGSLESVIEGKTGHFFREQSPNALKKAVEESQKMGFEPKTARDNALQYGKETFKRKIKSFIEGKTQEK